MPVEAFGYNVDSKLLIPSIDLASDVTKLVLEDDELPTPDTIVGSFSSHKHKTLLIGHSSTVFRDLHNVNIGDEIVYGDAVYIITAYNVLEKSEVNMRQILSTSNRDSLILMTCSGEDYGNGDSSHRLIVSAVLR